MNPTLQTLLTIAIPTISVWVAALISNSRLGTLEGDVKSLLKSDAANSVILMNIQRRIEKLEGQPH